MYCPDCCASGVPMQNHRERNRITDRVAPEAFEPMAAPEPAAQDYARPENDPRNNFNLPRKFEGVPKRDLASWPLVQALWDIETTDLWGSMGRVLCSVMRMQDGQKIVRRRDEYPGWADGMREDDSALVADVLRDLSGVDIVIAHNGLNFDERFMRTRGMIHGFPAVFAKKIVDPVLLARKYTRFKSNRLDHLARMLRCPIEKTDVDEKIWALAMFNGDKAAMNEIVDHCVLDVDVLGWVFNAVKPYVRQIDDFGSFR
jgi:hypothetical protein